MVPEEVESALASHNGLCDLCGTNTPRGKGAWIPDHDHKTGKIRGVICHNCNMGLGYFYDDPDRLELARKYLMERGEI